MIRLNCYWKNKDENGEHYMVYVDKKADEKKINLIPCATYFSNKKKIAVQYKVDINSKQQKNLWEKLNLTGKDEYKIKNPRKKKVEK